MGAKNRFLKFFYAAIVLCLSGLAFAASSSNKLSISVSQFRACYVTFPDFEKTLKMHDSKTELDVFLSNINNYMIEVSQTENRYFVVYLPKQFNGEIFFGGGARYEVDKVSLKIVKRELYE